MKLVKTMAVIGFTLATCFAAHADQNCPEMEKKLEELKKEIEETKGLVEHAIELIQAESEKKK